MGFRAGRGCTAVDRPLQIPDCGALSTEQAIGADFDSVEFDEPGAGSRTYSFDAYGARPADAPAGVLALFDTDYLIPDAIDRGAFELDLSTLPVDMLSISGHKLHAPKGIGALYIRRGTKLKTFQMGGHQEHGRRGGTENVPYIVGLGTACEMAAAHLKHGEPQRIAALRDRLEKGLLEVCPDTRINGDRINRLPNTTNISFEFIEGEAILYHLSDLGITASSGSACSSGSLEPSHVIRAMGVPFTAAHGSIRFSLSRYSTDADVDYALEQVPPVVTKLRELSPFID